MFRVLAVIVVLMLAGAATAQINHPYNEVGINTVEQPEGCEAAEIDVAPMTMFTCHLVLTKPWNGTMDRPVTTIGGLDVQVVIPPGVFLLAATVPSNPAWDCWGCEPGEFFFPMAMPVVDDVVTLVTMTLLAEGAGPYLLFLAPTGYPVVAGEISFTDLDDGHSLQVMHPVSGSFDVPVFAINWDGELSFCETVPVRDVSFGEVKALYR